MSGMKHSFIIFDENYWPTLLSPVTVTSQSTIEELAKRLATIRNMEEMRSLALSYPHWQVSPFPPTEAQVQVQQESE